ncbi:hypothetical protein BDV27DRAFT_138500 [Aspergillus caelatus]|uniref:Uncharacterized protein n=1 Tax=Aspergillus caelatus TaxID=61420 RepID=A0A5N6ZLS7_9EURO|nr:uncharacterized protein BDV27DRAFT_138500 [Aspergillus caelatus]KAE8357926.1 hypothetical protein BDV27DRAFT_138500 [Aspergillus caelatus]
MNSAGILAPNLRVEKGQNHLIIGIGLQFPYIFCPFFFLLFFWFFCFRIPKAEKESRRIDFRRAIPVPVSDLG